MSEPIWLFGAQVTWGILGSVWLFITIAVLLSLAKAFVNDDDYKAPFKFLPRGYDEVFSTIMVLLFSVLIGAIAGMVWFLAWPAAFIAVSLFSTRALVRFKKAYQKHKHDLNTGEVV